MNNSTGLVALADSGNLRIEAKKRQGGGIEVTAHADSMAHRTTTRTIQSGHLIRADTTHQQSTPRTQSTTISKGDRFFMGAGKAAIAAASLLVAALIITLIIILKTK